MGKKSSIKSEFTTNDDKLAFEDDVIRLVEPHKHVWDIKNIDFKNKSKRQNTFVTIGETLNKSGTWKLFAIVGSWSLNFVYWLWAADVCMKIWDNLRSQYFACHRSLPSGGGAEIRPSFRHYKSMSFISGTSVKAA